MYEFGSSFAVEEERIGAGSSWPEKDSSGDAEARRGASNRSTADFMMIEPRKMASVKLDGASSESRRGEVHKLIKRWKRRLALILRDKLAAW